jgi:prepilin-type processing-associated H-X9-DG protein
LTAVGVLVAIPILGIVASILLPAFARAREEARREACQENMEQIYAGLNSYAADHDGEFPAVGVRQSGVMFDLASVYPEYIDDPALLTCPTGDLSVEDVTAAIERNKRVTHDYVYFSHVVRTSAEAKAYLKAVKAARAEGESIGDEIVLEDGTVLPRIRRADSREYDRPESAIPVLIERPFHHMPPGFNVLFLDGHVEFGRLDAGDDFLWSSDFAEALETLVGPQPDPPLAVAVD